MNRKKLLCILIGVCVLCCGVLAAGGLIKDRPHEPVVILYENDVHCAVEGYSKLSALQNALSEEYGRVGVVSCGDFVQGGTLGAVSEGGYIVELMNMVGYDAAVLGNHEFDYRLLRLKELEALLDAELLCCNLSKTDADEPVFTPYTLVRYGTVDVAYIGITTPETISSSVPSQFMNESGEVIYTFNETALGARVQKYIDKAENDGADYIIALSHIGYSESGELDDITDLIAQTDGLDVVLDAHSHSVIEGITVEDKSGDDVLLSSTGTKFQNIGKLTLTSEGIETELLDTASLESTDAAIDTRLAAIHEEYAKLGDRKIGESEVALFTDDADGNRLVRTSETNLGNLCADALYTVTGADVAYVNGGGIRAPMDAGDVTFNDIFSVFPFNNQVVTAKVSGQTLLDLLEVAVMHYPEEDGSFPHVAGMRFALNAAVESSVQLDENESFVEVTGARRVEDAEILDRATGEYRPLDPDAVYTFTSFNYFILDFGGGMSMFADAEILSDEGMLDVECLEQYITEHLGGVIGEEYRETDRRIEVR
ncbi:MAG: bifunctional metallophosphatase/5'-nucleotidase [Clostridia bacterium]|nr:bifunctional metallophosphatase/5'-nucleotidase [Clostridia bacterium]